MLPSITNVTNARKGWFKMFSCNGLSLTMLWRPFPISLIWGAKYTTTCRSLEVTIVCQHTLVSWCSWPSLNHWALESHTDSNAQPEHHCSTVPLTASLDEVNLPFSLQPQVMMGIYTPQTQQTNHQLVTSPTAPVVLLSQHLQPHSHHNTITQCKSPKSNRDGNTKWPQLPVGPPAKNTTLQFAK